MKITGTITLPHLLSRTTTCEILRDLFEYEVPVVEIDDDDVQGFSDEFTYFQVEDRKTGDYAQIRHEVFCNDASKGIQTRLAVFGDNLNTLLNVIDKIQEDTGGKCYVPTTRNIGEPYRNTDMEVKRHPVQFQEIELFATECQRKMMSVVNTTLTSISQDNAGLRAMSSSLGETLHTLIKDTCEQTIERQRSLERKDMEEVFHPKSVGLPFLG